MGYEMGYGKIENDEIFHKQVVAYGVFLE